jgi:7-cyano-7-deazaguanine synthase
MKRKKAVVLLSGGIDSSTTLAVAKSVGYELYALSFDYNQRHKKEIDSALLVASALRVKKHLITHFDLRDIGGSALTSDIEVPKSVIRRCGETETQRDERVLSDSPSHRVSASVDIPVTYVPARNTIFLSFALGWAEVLEAEDIFIGANAIDYSGYPDCRPEYLLAFEKMANIATKASVEGRLRFTIKAPLILMRKSEIVKKGIELGLDYALTWSCYDPQPATTRVRSPKLKVKSYKAKNSELRAPNPELIPCGLCDSCVIRAEGFREAGVKDPLLESKGIKA